MSEVILFRPVRFPIATHVFFTKIDTVFIPVGKFILDGTARLTTESLEGELIYEEYLNRDKALPNSCRYYDDIPNEIRLEFKTRDETPLVTCLLQRVERGTLFSLVSYNENFPQEEIVTLVMNLVIALLAYPPE